MYPFFKFFAYFRGNWIWITFPWSSVQHLHNERRRLPNHGLFVCISLFICNCFLVIDKTDLLLLLFFYIIPFSFIYRSPFINFYFSCFCPTHISVQWSIRSSYQSLRASWRRLNSYEYPIISSSSIASASLSLLCKTNNPNFTSKEDNISSISMCFIPAPFYSPCLNCSLL